jgi:hypothetical protein
VQPEPQLFALADSGAGTGMHAGSGYDFESRSNIKWNKKVKKSKKIKNESPTFCFGKQWWF